MQYNKLTKKELEEYGRTLGIELDRRKKKDDLISAIKNAEKNAKKKSVAKKAPAKKTTAKKTTAKKAPAKRTSKAKALIKVAAKKAPAKKKPAKMTDADKVLNIIKRSKKGVTAQDLAKKTGFNAKKIANIVFKANKDGKIRIVSKGIYLGA